ncbi:hypothetical protein LCGC14_1959910 [marine sediment metagenome]|uniref:histidine kinase n=1 Tax=marine sediment metagenome TaxID=412755 RepID=A0A0F9HT89_9ZZZZ
MRYLTAAVSAALVLVAMFALATVAEGRKGKAKTTGSGYEKVVFVDKGYAFHGGPPPHTATDAAKAFKRLQGKTSWPGSSTVKYTVDASACGDDCSGAISDVNAGLAVWGVSGVTLTQDNITPDINPCTGSGNSVDWASVDGSGDTLAFTSVCRNVATKAIVGFEIVFDADETWSDSGDSGKFDIQATAFDLSEVATHVAEQFGFMAQRKKLTIRCAVPPLTVLADAKRTQQVLVNLVSNSVKFTESGHIEITAKQQGKDIVVTVEDTGCGIPDSMRDKVFDEFQQADSSSTRKAGGTGLGLAIVKRIVEGHGGKVTLSSIPDLGTRVTFTLPAADADSSITTLPHSGLQSA